MGTTPPAPTLEHERETEATPTINFLRYAIEDILAITGETPEAFAQRSGAPDSLMRRCHPPPRTPRHWIVLSRGFVRFHGPLAALVLEPPTAGWAEPRPDVHWRVVDLDNERIVRRGHSWQLQGALREASRALRQEGGGE